ncbi:hypothetical protein [Streptomyces sp. NBC_01718]|uniref:hypothetical protein n=1 Tax=Streptomyces sp. NBC_01718 TaxID=2975919 RepID=UPI00352C406C
MRRHWPGSGQVPRCGPDLVGITDADEVRAAVVYPAGRGQRDAERTGRRPDSTTPASTGPKVPTMTVVRISRLGGPPAAEPAVPHAVPYRDPACPVRLLSLLDGTDVTAVPELYARVSGVLEPLSVGRPPDFSSGGGDAPKHHDERARKRPAGLVSQCDPASLFGTVHESA